MSSRTSSATAASTAAISSGSGGSGMYSLAPAWIAATAARASVAVPQATIGTAAGAQHIERLLVGFRMGDGRALVHRELGRGGELALERPDDRQSHAFI